MAEGDTIARLAIRLHRTLAGRLVDESHFMTGRTALVDLSGRNLLQVASVGKHLLFRFSGGHTLHVHLRMDGRLRVRTLGSVPSRALHRPGVRFVIGFDDMELIGERVPVVEVVATRTESRVVGHLGPDLCDPHWDDDFCARAVARLASQAKRPLVEALLDQRNLAGIGNLYAVEGCFLSGFYPWTPVGRLSGLGRIVDLEHRLLSSGVRTGAQITTGLRRRGETHWVYGRYRKPCRRCSTPITFRSADGSAAHRETWWCPSCQPQLPDSADLHDPEGVGDRLGLGR